MSKKSFHHAFKVAYTGRVRELVTHVHILQPNGDPRDCKIFNAIWDTGATNTVITQKVVDELKLIPTGITKVKGVNSITDVYTYIVNIGLPNSVLVENVAVTCSDLNSDNCNVLIGMDIIGSGDFAVCHPDGKTVFSFCLPAHRNPIDLLEKSDRVNSRKH